MENKSIGQFIAALRKANGFTQQEVADRLHVSNKAVSRWERSECAPDLSLIPALAELFGVTCDELLKGERIHTPQTEKGGFKAEKQLKILVNRALSGFKTLIWISLALSAVGLICMFGISYGFYRPVIGFAVMLLFETAAVAVTAVAVNRLKTEQNGNELLENADFALTEQWEKALGSLSYIAFSAVISVIVLSLPLLICLSDYVNSVLAFESYFPLACILALCLVLVFMAFKETYFSRITGQPPRSAAGTAVPKRRAMTALQLAAAAAAAVLLLIAPYFEEPEGSPVAAAFCYAALASFAANIAVFIAFTVRFKAERKALILPGIRNMLMLLPVILLQGANNAAFGYLGEGSIAAAEAYERYLIWQPQYIRRALGSALLIAAVFRLIEAFRKKL